MLLRLLIGALALTTLLGAAASAQVGGDRGNNAGGIGGINMLPGQRRLTPEEAIREQQIEMQYNETVRKIPDKKASKDPWGNIRSAPGEGSAAKQK